MRKLTYVVASTIDGFVAGPDGGDPSGPDGLFVFEGGHMNAILEDWPDILPAPAREALGIDPPNRRFDTVLEGRASYEVGLAAGVSDAYPHLEHYVFSRTLTKCPGPRVKLTADDPVETVRELKRRDGLGIWLCGGGTLANALRAEIDELVVKLHPVVLGNGIPLFRGEFGRQRFDLTDTQIYDSGVMHLTYTKPRNR